MTRLRGLHQALRWGVLAGIALLLLTPFVVTPGTLFPFVVGKALWSRSIIEAVFALWAALALARGPAYRPPRSWLLILLAAGLGVSLLAAGFGVSWQRSLWSTYERMQGVVDLAHWFALAVVLASMFRTAAEWRALLNLNLAAQFGYGLSGHRQALSVGHTLLRRDAGAASAAHQRAVRQPALPERLPGGEPAGGAGIPGAIVADGACPHTRTAAATAKPPAPQTANPAPPTAGEPQTPSPPPPAAGAAAWPDAFEVAGHPVPGNGCRPPLLGVRSDRDRPEGSWDCSRASVFLFSPMRFPGTGGCGGPRGAALIALGASTVLFGVRFFGPAPDSTAGAGPDTLAAELITRAHIQHLSIQSRLAAWETGLKGFAERPLLGWGPSNFDVVFGRFATGYAAAMEPHDKAHSQFVEVAATTGAAGLAAYLALWALVFTVVLRAAARVELKDRALTLFVGAALVDALTQNQFLFNTASGSLQTILLLGFAVSLEKTVFPDARRPRLPARWAAVGAPLLRRRGPRMALAAAAAALTAAGLTAHSAIYAAAHLQYMTAARYLPTILAGGIDGFRPLANTYRWHLFNEIDRNWQTLRTGEDARAQRLLEWAERESEEVARTEPQNWRIHQSLARMYQAVAETDPEYEGAAQRYLERALALAPNRAVFASAPARPRFAGGLSARRRPPRAALERVRGHGLLYGDRRDGRRYLEHYCHSLRPRPDVVHRARDDGSGHLSLRHPQVPVRDG